MKLKDKIKGIFKRNKVTAQRTSSWPSKSSPRTDVFKTRKKIRVPGLRTAKRGLASLLMLINFCIMCASLLSASATQPLFWLFFFNWLILVDYLWKTRGKETI